MGIENPLSGGVTSVAGQVGAISLSDIGLGTGSTVRFTKLGLGTDPGANALSAEGSVIVSSNITVGGYVLTASPFVFIKNNAAGLYFGVDDDLVIVRDAANTSAQRNGPNAQARHLYGRHGGGTDFHRFREVAINATASAVSGAMVTLSELIPAGATLVGLTSKVTTGLGSGNSTTGYTIGDGADADRWGVASAIVAGTVTQDSDWQDGTIEKFTAAQDVVLTAVGGNFDGTGVIDVTVFCLMAQAD